MHRRTSSLLLPVFLAGILGILGGVGAIGAVGSGAAEAPLALPPPAQLLQVFVSAGLATPRDTTYRIFRDGSEFVVVRDLPGAVQVGCKVYWGMLTSDAFARLTAALTAGRVGQQSGRCGVAASSQGPGFIGVTWYGQNGRTGFFQFGTGGQDDCSAGIQEIVHALPLLSRLSPADKEVQFLSLCPAPA